MKTFNASESMQMLQSIQTHLEAYHVLKRSLAPPEAARERVIAMLSSSLICPLCQIPVDYHITVDYISFLYGKNGLTKPLCTYVEACNQTSTSLKGAGIYNKNLCISCCMEFHALLTDYTNPRFGKLHRPIHSRLHELKNRYFPGFTQRAKIV